VDCNQSVVLLSRQTSKMALTVFSVARRTTSDAILFVPHSLPQGTPLKMVRRIHDQ
jgi:hypothetical protein